MKIRINLVVEVDPAQWGEVYGDFQTERALRDDVRAYFLNLAQTSAAADEAGAKVSLAK